MTRFVLTPKANHDLHEILEYIATDSAEYSFRVGERFEQVFEFLGENPEAGRIRRDLTGQPLRFFPVYSYLVVYLPTFRPIRIIRVLSASRDVKRILE